MLPKIELHVHLDGSIRPSTVAEVLNMNEKEVEEKMIVTDNCYNLNEYLSKFDLPIKAMQTEENLTKVACELCEDMQKENIIYAEIRFAPLKHTHDLTLDQVISAVLKGMKKTDLKTNLILCMMRNDSEEDNLKIIDIAEKYLNKGVVAVDLAGAEAIYKTKSFQKLFDVAKRKNIPFTIHAGEADGSSSIKSAISFGANRIGHGIRAVEDPKLIEEIIKKDILLEICPTSNLQTKVVKNYQNHPIYELYKKGCLINISTDNRTVSNTTLTDEYKHLNFKDEQLIKMNLDSIKKAFLNDKEKEQLKKLYLQKIE